jgi:integrase
VTGKGKNVGPDRLSGSGSGASGQNARRLLLASGVICQKLTGRKLFGGHSLRAGLASSAEVDERYVQKQLGHASAEMTRKYQRRRDRFRVNLTKGCGAMNLLSSPAGFVI